MGAIGPSSFIQIIDGRAGIYNRTTGALMASGSGTQLAAVSSMQATGDVQVMWDPMTNRFFYSMFNGISATDNKISYGFSKTSSPGNITSDWCHYELEVGAPFADSQKLGDSASFIIIGANEFSDAATGPFIGSVSLRHQQTSARNGLPRC
ncbi:MAG: hypothetical protein WDN46_23850 [Methylocella sp.]